MEVLVVLGVALVLIITIAIIKAREHKYTTFLLNNSFALNELSKLNESFKFANIPNDYCESHVYDNLIYFNSISCEDYLIYQLQFKEYKIEKMIEGAKNNNTLYEKYTDELTRISNFGNYKNAEKLNLKYLLKLEKELFSEKVLNPTRKFCVKVVLYCSKINGAIYAEKQNVFTPEEINALIKRLNNKNHEFYNDRGIWDALCRVERGRVSNKMRFAIYERDGYKCCYCGRSQKYNDLEIDHIKPIAKGGKSTYDNLQTLCRTCNKNKGDSY